MMDRIFALVRKEALEFVRTWRGPSFLIVWLFFAVMSPLLALITPQLVGSMMDSQSGVTIVLPDPTYLDAYAQWLKNLSQIGIALVAFASAGLIPGERSIGADVFVLAKPVSRGAYVISKYVVQAVMVSVITLVATTLVLGLTYALFGEAPAGDLYAGIIAWLIGALLAMSIAVTFSTVMPTLAAGLVTLVFVGVLSASALWEFAAEYTPAGLYSASSALISGTDTPVAMCMLTGVVSIVALLAVAGRLLSAREL